MILPSSVGRGGRRMVVRVERGGERVSEGRDGRGVGELAVKEGRREQRSLISEP